MSENNPQTDPAVNLEGNTDPVKTEPKEPEKTFTQAEVNNFLAKESKKAQEKIFKDLGIEDFNSAKEGFEKFKEWQESQKSDAQKQAEALATAEQELAQAKGANKALEAKLSALSQGVKAESVDDVIALSERLVSDEVTIDQAISQTLAKYPQFGATVQEPTKAPTITVTGNPNASSPTVSKAEYDKMTYAERVNLKATDPALFEQLSKGD